MTLFDARSSKNRAQWKDSSLDYKLMFVYHGCMMVLFMTGRAFSVRQELLATMVLVAILFSISVRNRQMMNWRWPSVQAKDVLTVGGTLLLTGFFLFAATPYFSPFNPGSLPWYLAGLGIAVFGVLNALKIVHASKADFLKECEAIGTADVDVISTAEAIPVVPADLLWKRVDRAVYGVLFMLVWLDGVASFYFYGVAFRNGSPSPTPTQLEPMRDHGRIVYIQHSQKMLIDVLQKVMMIGIPSVLICGLILHFFLGAELFSNTPTFQEWRKQRNRV